MILILESSNFYSYYISESLGGRMQKEIIVNKVKDENGWLSCMSAYTLTHSGKEYRTAEALFQCMRFHKYPYVQDDIREQKSPMGAKMKARKNRGLLNRVGKWDEAPEDLTWMKECLELKLEQHPGLKQKLIDTGDAIIIEDTTKHTGESAQFWGAKKNDGKWVGENHLGNLWMEIREDLKK